MNRFCSISLWFCLAFSALSPLSAQPPAERPRVLRTLPGAMRETLCAAFSPDGKLLAAGGRGLTRGEIKLFDIATGEEAQQLELPTPPQAIAFSRDGSRLVASYKSPDGNGHTLQAWTLPSGTEAYEFRSVSGEHFWSFSSDGKQLATWNTDFTVTIWDAATGDEVFSFKPEGYPRSFRCLRWRPGANEIVMAEFGHPGAIFFYSCEDGREIRKIKTEEANANSLALSGDGEKMVAKVRRNSITIWNLKTGRVLAETTPWRLKSESPVAFSPNGKLIALRGSPANNDKSGPIKVWSGDSGKELFEIKERAPTSLQFSPDSSLLAGVLGKDGVLIWHVGPPDPAYRAPGGSAPVTAQDRPPEAPPPTPPITPDRPAPATKAAPQTPDDAPKTSFSLPQSLTLRAHPDPKPGEYAGDKRMILDLALSPDDSKLASVNNQGEVRLWDLSTGESTPLASDSSARRVLFTADGKSLLAGNRSQISMWDVETTSGRGKFGDGSTDGAAWYVASDGAAVATLDYPGNGVNRVRIWNTADAESALVTLDLQENLKCLAIARGGAMAALGSKEDVRLFDLTAGTEIAPIRGLPGRATQLAFHPNGKVLAAGLVSGEVQFWDVSKSPARLVAKQATRWSSPNPIYFSPNGQTLVLEGNDITLWDVASRSLRAPIPSLTRRVAFSADGRTLVGSTKNYISLAYDLQADKLLKTIESTLPNGEAANQWGASGAYAVSRNGAFAAIGTKSGLIDVRPLGVDAGASQAVVLDLKVPEMRKADGNAANLPQIGFSADGKYVVYRRQEWTVMGDPVTGKTWFPIVPPEPQLPPKALQTASYFFVPGQDLLTALSGSATAPWRYNIQSGRIFGGGTERRVFHSFALSPDQNLVAALVTPPSKPMQLTLLNPKDLKPLGEPLLAEISSDGGSARNAQFAFSADSRRLALLLGRSIRVWDLDRRAELTLNAEGDWHRPYLIENGDVLAAVSRNLDKLKLFDLETAQLKGEIDLKRLHTGIIRDVAVSPVDPLFASVGDHGEVLLRDLSSGDLVARFAGHMETVDSVAFAPDGKSLATGAAGFAGGPEPKEQSVRVWSFDPQALAKNRAANPELAGKMAPVGKVEPSAPSEGERTRPAARKVESPREIASMKIDVGLARGTSNSKAYMEFSPDARHLAIGIGNYGPPTSLIDVADNKLLWKSDDMYCIRGEYEEIRPYQFSADGKSIVTWTGNGGGLYAADLQTGTAERKFDSWTSARFAIAPDGATIALGGDPHDDNAPVLLLLSGADRKELGPSLKAPAGAATAVAYSPDGALLAVGVSDRKGARLHLLDAATLEVKVVLSEAAGSNRISQILFSPDGKNLCLQRGGVIEVWSVADQKLVRTTRSTKQEGYKPLAFIGGGGLLAMQDDQQYVVYDVLAGSPRFSFEGSYRPADVTPDGRILATFSNEGVIIWDLMRGAALPTPAAHDDDILDAALSDDGRTLATVAIDNTIKIWSLDGRKE